ncbi:TraB/GumN family protein [Flavihumibacter cheonanensis]|uniref:TraB/GumN family protein n=1 Tax=Flavihumibacter cheonanensis TaxID=1442385 RepID=UPI001EF99C93|nr:TraB/GumN family protein [Flavihumibacter cheonanensis]MCG7751457.1 TraB/GumN family protein [Flavihumibacter cheonanensis]
MKFRLFFSVISVLVLNLSISAQQPKTLLWQVSGNGLSKPSFIFGTMHLLCSAEEMMSDSLLSALSRSEQVFFEIDMDNPGEMLGVFKFIRMKDNKKIGDLLSPDEYQRVKNYFSNNKTVLPLSMMERFKPYFVAAMLSEAKMPCATKTGMEELILKQAKKEGKLISGLESIEFQASVFDSIPYEEQAKELLKAIDEEAKQDSFTNRMAAIYLAQDLDQIEQLTLEEEGGVSSYLELFLYGRNAIWIPAMEAAMKKQPALFAVGAAHLPGEKGVLNLLKKAGYKVEPVSNPVR